MKQVPSLLRKLPQIDKVLISVDLHVYTDEEGDSAFFFPEISKAIS